MGSIISETMISTTLKTCILHQKHVFHQIRELGHQKNLNNRIRFHNESLD